MHNLEFGVDFPHSISETDPLRYAEIVEEAGYSSLWCGENMFVPVPRIDPLVMLAAWAVSTSKLRLGTCAVRLPMRNPFALAQAATTIDILSNGRLILGVGVGGDRPNEFKALGVDLATRGARTDEAIVVLHTLWTTANAAFDGKFYTFEGVTMIPRPVQEPYPPIWIGGRRIPAVRRAAKYGQGFMPYLETPNYYRRALAELGQLAQDYGRSPEEICPALALHVTIGRNHDDAHSVGYDSIHHEYGLSEELFEKYCLHGTPKTVSEGLRDFVDAGVRHFVFLWAVRPGGEVEQVRLMADEVIPDVMGQIDVD